MRSHDALTLGHSSQGGQPAPLYAYATAVRARIAAAREDAELQKMPVLSTPWRLAAIHAGDWLVKLLVTALTESAWRCNASTVAAVSDMAGTALRGSRAR
jgi:hypothetical protein